MNPAATLANKLLTVAFQSEASDIHFYPSYDQTDIYFRVHGQRELHRSISFRQYQMLLTYFKFTSGMDIGEIRKPQNGTILHHTAKNDYALRLSTLPVIEMESLTIRILPQQISLKLEQLFLFPNQFSRIKKWVKNRAGLILLTGPTGSGKSTTLYALLQAILQEKSYQTITLEDPIEKNIPHILQVQINEKAQITYENTLKAILRHDPDIIMIGEIRDEKTAKFALEASLTGHLVLSTLHAKDTLGTISRLVDLGIKRSELSQSLIAVAAIQLLPILIRGGVKRRAAILELLDEDIEAVIKEKMPLKLNNFHTFDHLRKKAYAYGFISTETFFQT